MNDPDHHSQQTPITDPRLRYAHAATQTHVYHTDESHSDETAVLREELKRVKRELEATRRQAALDRSLANEELAQCRSELRELQKQLDGDDRNKAKSSGLASADLESQSVVTSNGTSLLTDTPTIPRRRSLSQKLGPPDNVRKSSLSRDRDSQPDLTEIACHKLYNAPPSPKVCSQDQVAGLQVVENLTSASTNELLQSDRTQLESAAQHEKPQRQRSTDALGVQESLIARESSAPTNHRVSSTESSGSRKRTQERYTYKELREQRRSTLSQDVNSGNSAPGERRVPYTRRQSASINSPHGNGDMPRRNSYKDMRQRRPNSKEHVGSQRGEPAAESVTKERTDGYHARRSSSNQFCDSEQTERDNVIEAKPGRTKGLRECRPPQLEVIRSWGLSRTAPSSPAAKPKNDISAKVFSMDDVKNGAVHRKSSSSSVKFPRRDQERQIKASSVLSDPEEYTHSPPPDSRASDNLSDVSDERRARKSIEKNSNSTRKQAATSTKAKTNGAKTGGIGINVAELRKELSKLVPELTSKKNKS